ncbi:MAG: ABC transporter ATP-binding protein [Hyphomicrobiales bacterium]|nr:ABC transporter ATP-binding protein [Hyphomicrobiales bacterium]
MPAIALAEVTKAWGSTVAVREVSFTVEPGTFVVLLGPSGCGKSTTLRMIAGLEDVSSGRITIDEADMTHAPPARRRVSMVFQSYALFPHLNVRENILFGLKVRKVARAEQETRLARVAKMVGLSDLLDRKPAQLSGGQRQRVAVARAVIAENPICLMDEPLSNLDAKLRHEMRVELRDLQQRLAMTVVYVTHDQTEAMSMADKVVLMREGRIEQSGTPEDLYDRPATTFTAGFIGTPPMNLVRLGPGAQGAAIAGTDGPAVVAEAPGGCLLGIRPEHIEISEHEGIPATIRSCDYLGADTIVAARCGAQELLVRAPGRVRLAPGRQIGLSWADTDVHIFDAADGARIADARPLSIAA